LEQLQQLQHLQLCHLQRLQKKKKKPTTMAAKAQANPFASKVQRILAGPKREQFVRDATARLSGEVVAFAKLITGFKKAPAAAK
jgi:hypothetical protein